MALTFGSLFAGIGGFDLGFERAGMVPAFQVEIDQRCDYLLHARWPGVQKHHDIRTVDGRDLPAVDVLCGGFPCQDLSVAGRRAGLAGERSGLWFEFRRLVEATAPQVVVIENVPGLLSASKGRDFAVVLQGLVDLGYGVAYRVLDARYFGTPQRRRRVFIVASLGDGRAAEVLSLTEGLRGNPAPRREAGQGAAAGSRSGAPVACGASLSGAGWWREGVGPLKYSDDNGTEHLVAACLTSSYGKQVDSSDRAGGPPNLVFQCQGNNVGPMGTLRAGNGHVTGGVPFVAQEVAHTLRAEYDASEDGTGRGTPIVPVAFDWMSGDSTDRSFRGKARSYRVRAGDYTGALQAVKQDAVAIPIRSNPVPPSEAIPILDPRGRGGESTNNVHYAMGVGHPGDPMYALTSHQNGVYHNYGVRRLTPTECERLQGFPDGWTLVDEDTPDSVRYRQLGNAVNVAVTTWLGSRIVEVFGDEAGAVLESGA